MMDGRHRMVVTWVIRLPHGGSMTPETSEQDGTTLVIVPPLLQTHN